MCVCVCVCVRVQSTSYARSPGFSLVRLGFRFVAFVTFARSANLGLKHHRIAFQELKTSFFADKIQKIADINGADGVRNAPTQAYTKVRLVPILAVRFGFAALVASVAPVTPF